MRVKHQDRVGQIFGQLTVTETYREEDEKGVHRSYAVCSCSCGSSGFVSRIDALTRGATFTCGCWDHSANSGMRKHGKWKDRVYGIWRDMLDRTCNKSHTSYDNYSSLGVDDKWKDFISFYRDMGDPPSKLHTLDRIDNEKGYSKDNCRWATRSIQAKNQKKRNLGSASSVYKGVVFHKRYRGYWSSGVTKDYTTVRLSAGKDEIRAAKFFNFMTKYLYHEMVTLNEVDDLSLTVEEAEMLHNKIEGRFTFNESSGEYEPKVRSPKNQGEK